MAALSSYLPSPLHAPLKKLYCALTDFGNSCQYNSVFLISFPPAMNTKNNTQRPKWTPLFTSIKLILSKPKLLLWSVMLFAATILITWLADHLALSQLDSFAHNLMPAEPVAEGILGWLKYAAWLVGDWLYLILSRVVTFYLAFLLAYTLTTPGYAFLSRAAEKMRAGEYFNEDAAFTFSGILRDLLEGVKIGIFGIFVSILAILLNFLPVVGQVAAFLLYCFYSTLLFIDFPASRQRWTLGRKLRWLWRYKGTSLRLGVGPALLSMIPLFNIFAMALLFPLLTVHATLNFTTAEVQAGQSHTEGSLEVQ
jgi:CysZ protein